MAPIRFLALDIDGTLLDSRWELPADNVLAVAAAVEAGVEVGLVTGRRFDFARPVMDALAVPLTMIVSNGAVVKDRTGTTLARRVLDRRTASRVLELSRAWRDCAGLLFDRTDDVQIVFERIDPADERRHLFYEINRDTIAERPLESCLDEDPVQIMFSGGLERIRALRDALLNALKGGQTLKGGQSHVSGAARGQCDCPPFSVSTTEYEHRDFALLDVMASGCSKGAAVAEWAVRRGYTRDEVMAIGDNLNDFEMLEFAGLAVVMENAAPALRARIDGFPHWRFTTANDEAGVARAIREHILRR